eukprot:PhM_4_TR3115/c1_g1_i1/m.21969/K13250/SSR2; translocon-associated protein subunit beta
MSLTRTLVLLGLIACVFFASAVRADDDEAGSPAVDAETGAAFLLVRKSLSAAEVIVDSEIKVTVSITNAGRSPAFSVKAVDDAWKANVLSGERQATFDKVLPRETVSFSYTIRAPATPAVMDCPEAKVTFLAEAGAAEESAQVVRSTRVNEEIEMPIEKQTGVISVLTASDYERKHTRHIKEWATFFLLLTIPLGMPLYLYQVRSNELDVLTKKIVKSN